MKKDNLFTGWRQVLSFTFKEAAKVKSFKVVTILLGLLVFAVAFLSNLLPAALSSSDSEEDNNCPVGTVYVSNATDIDVDFSALKVANPFYEDVNFTMADDTADAILSKISSPESTDLVLNISKENDEYDLSMTLPQESALFSEDCYGLLNDAILFFQSEALRFNGISEEAAALASVPVNSTSYFEGEEDSNSFGQAMLEMMFPMVFTLVLYIMIILYGQSVAKSVISEKSSKLMEFILVSIKPYGLITGKVLAMFLIALMQFILWLGCGIGGFLLGDLVTGKLYPDYSNFLVELLSFMSENGVFAFTPIAIILSVIGIALAFLFYCSLAGAVSSSLTSTENLSSGMSLFMLPVVFSFLAAYMVPLYGNPTLETILKYIPFTAAFMVPSRILIGSIPVLEGTVELIILAIFTFLVMLLTGKLYKARVFYRGKGNVAKSFTPFAFRK